MINDLKEEFNKNFTADCHDLAHQDYGNNGEAQKQPVAEVRDLGWHKNLSDMPGALIGGVPNENLFAMIRRFNKDVFDVRAVPPGNTTGLDLTEAWDDDHVSDKVTLHFQRAYLSIVLGLASFGKQVSRLRSWKETRRTAVLCVIYIMAWFFNLLVPLLIGTLSVISGSEKARNAIFPPAPLALVNIRTGGLQRPQAGQLGTTDTLTGAPEKAAGEAKEEEAANFVDNIRHIIARAIGMNQSSNKEGDPLQSKVPELVQKTVKSVKEVGSAPGHATARTGKDMTQKPMEELLWDKLQPKDIDPVIKTIPHAIGEIVDDWERFTNAISPTPPFPRLSFLRIESILVPLFLTSLFVPQHMVYKATGFAIGFGLFGDPIISRGLKLLNKKFPHWLEMLEPKNNILCGVPTNNQLTLTLLRVGEVHRSPIPPVPNTKPTDANELPKIQLDHVPLNTSRHEIARVIEPSRMPKSQDDHSSPPNKANTSENANNGKEEQPKHPHLSRIISMLKGNAKAIVEIKMAADHVRAAAGSHEAQGHLGILPKEKNLIYAGPAEFKARFKGEKGWLHIDNPPTTRATTGTPPEPRLLFVKGNERSQAGKIDAAQESKIEWSIALRDIHRLKRATAFANKPAEVAADWSGDTELLGSLEIVDEAKKTWRITAIPERDELFNRLVALGKQRWENM